MKRLAVALGVAAAAVVGATWWLSEPAEVASAPEQPRVLANAEVAAPPLPAPVASLVSRKRDELLAMSESVRNSTFVVAIRAAGFMCEDVVDVYASADVPAWRARCPDNHAYYLRVVDAGDLMVEPTLDYFDGVRAPVEPPEPRR